MSENKLMSDVFYADEAEQESPGPTEQAESASEEPTEAPGQEVAEPEESESESVEVETEEQDQETLYVEFDGEEHSLDDVREWKAGHLKNADYTQKTQALAEERKTFEAEREAERKQIAEATVKVSDLADQLEVLVAEDQEIDWADLKEYNPDEYIKQKELADKRKAKLDEIKAARQAPVDSPEVLQAEQKKLFDANPGWMEDGKPTKQFEADTKLMQEYAINSGIAPEEFAMITRANLLQIILDAAKYSEVKKKAVETKAKREKVPVVTKPKAAKPKQPPKSMADVFYS